MASSESVRVNVAGDDPQTEVCRNLLVDAVKAALREHHVTHADIGLYLVSDDDMASMNEKHLGHEGPTDVLTFDLGESDGDAVLEGEIALSVDTARREAVHHGHGVEAELALYAVHGVLHLLQYQDDTPQAASHMHDTEDRILGSLGFGPVYASSRR